MKNLTLGSLFSGSGGFELAGMLAGITPVWNSEIEPYPILVTHNRLPDVQHFGDVSKLNGAELPPVDIITFGSPCQDMSVAGKRNGLDGSRSGLFHEAVRIISEMRRATNEQYPRFIVWENVCFDEDTLITCENGCKHIKDICIGDKVKTHTGKYQPVVKVCQTKKQDVIKLSASGGEPLIVTPNHPFLARKKIYSGNSVRKITEPEWTPAENLTKNHLIGYRIDIPSLPDDFISEAEAWAVGRWIADGSVDLKKSNPRMFFSIGKGKEETARMMLEKLPYTVYENKPHPTATNFCFTSHEFYTLIADAGRGAGNKRIPSFVFQLPFSLQKIVLEGYLSGDGYIRSRNKGTELAASTASRELAYGISRLIRNVYKTAVNISVSQPKESIIEGRVLHPNYPTYSIHATLNGKCSSSIAENDIIWQPVKSIEYVKEKKTVYNLSVLEDNTYEANGIIVHNCGAYSSNNGEDFRTVLEEICQIKESDIFIPRPPDKWTKSGEILGENFSVAWRTLDAQYWGVPQRRKRIYLVADFDGQRAGSILFESEGLSGYSAESLRAWQGTACRAEKSTRTAGRNICLCDQGGERIDVLEDKTATLRAEAHHPPCVLESAGFCTEHSAKSRSIGYEEEKSPTLRAGVVPATVYENHSQDSRYTGPLKIAPTISATYGMGGNNQPFIVENHPSDGRIKISDDEICQTLTSRCGTGGGNVPLLVETPKVYGICAKHSNAMLSDNPNSGFYEAETSRTLDTSNQSPSKNQGGMVVIEGNGSRPSHQGNGYKESEIMYTLNTVEVPAVAMADTAYAISRDNHFSVSEDVAGTAVARGPATVVHSNGDHYSTSKNSHHTVASHEKANTLVASDWKDPPVVNDAPNNEPTYIVRRLTPTECARLQGLPDWWCKNLDNLNPTDEEIQFWTEVWNEWSKINGKKPKTEKQIRKWLANPYSDSAEYKLYGNAICVNCGYFVISGIAYFAGKI